MVLLYMITFTINISPMLAYMPAPWILWEMKVLPVLLPLTMFFYHVFSMFLACFTYNILGYSRDNYRIIQDTGGYRMIRMIQGIHHRTVFLHFLLWPAWLVTILCPMDSQQRIPPALLPVMDGPMPPSDRPTAVAAFFRSSSICLRITGS